MGVGVATIGVGSDATTVAIVAIAGLSLPLVEALGRPVSVGVAAIGVRSNATTISIVAIARLANNARHKGKNSDLKSGITL